jgi:predicted GIY-YIG superfamily endonuclease
MSLTSIYVIGPENGPFKIGYSDDPQRRLSNIQTGQAVEVKLFYSEQAESGVAKIIEKLIHRNLAHKRIRGEWFSVTLSEAIDEVKFAFIRYEGEDNLPLQYKHKLV